MNSWTCFLFLEILKTKNGFSKYIYIYLYIPCIHILCVFQRVLRSARTSSLQASTPTSFSVRPLRWAFSWGRSRYEELIRSSTPTNFFFVQLTEELIQLVCSRYARSYPLHLGQDLFLENPQNFFLLFLKTILISYNFRKIISNEFLDLFSIFGNSKNQIFSKWKWTASFSP